MLVLEGLQRDWAAHSAYSIMDSLLQHPEDCDHMTSSSLLIV